jgi:hypothetical protein
MGVAQLDPEAQDEHNRELISMKSDWQRKHQNDPPVKECNEEWLDAKKNDILECCPHCRNFIAPSEMQTHLHNCAPQHRVFAPIPDEDLLSGDASEMLSIASPESIQKLKQRQLLKSDEVKALKAKNKKNLAPSPRLKTTPASVQKHFAPFVSPKKKTNAAHQPSVTESIENLKEVVSIVESVRFSQNPLVQNTTSSSIASPVKSQQHSLQVQPPSTKKSPSSSFQANDSHQQSSETNSDQPSNSDNAENPDKFSHGSSAIPIIHESGPSAFDSVAMRHSVRPNDRSRQLHAQPEQQQLNADEEVPFVLCPFCVRNFDYREAATHVKRCPDAPDHIKQKMREAEEQNGFTAPRCHHDYSENVECDYSSSAIIAGNASRDCNTKCDDTHQFKGRRQSYDTTTSCTVSDDTTDTYYHQSAQKQFPPRHYQHQPVFPSPTPLVRCYTFADDMAISADPLSMFYTGRSLVGRSPYFPRVDTTHPSEVLNSSRQTFPQPPRNEKIPSSHSEYTFFRYDTIPHNSSRILAAAAPLYHEAATSRSEQQPAVFYRRPLSYW